MKKLITGIMLMMVYSLLISIFEVPKYLLPSVVDVVNVFINDFAILIDHTIITILEAIIGLGAGLIVALLLVVLIEYIPRIKNCILNSANIIQNIPYVVLAPLIIIWFGFGLESKILTIAIVTFFPIFINMNKGLETIEQNHSVWVNTITTNKYRSLRYYKLPLIMPQLIAGMKISAAYALVTAITAEWLGASKGLGVYLLRAMNQFATDKIFAATIIIVVFSLLIQNIINQIGEKYE